MISDAALCLLVLSLAGNVFLMVVLGESARRLRDCRRKAAEAAKRAIAREHEIGLRISRLR